MAMPPGRRSAVGSVRRREAQAAPPSVDDRVHFPSRTFDPVVGMTALCMGFCSGGWEYKFESSCRPPNADGSLRYAHLWGERMRFG